MTKNNNDAYFCSSDIFPSGGKPNSMKPSHGIGIFEANSGFVAFNIPPMLDVKSFLFLLLGSGDFISLTTCSLIHVGSYKQWFLFNFRLSCQHDLEIINYFDEGLKSTCTFQRSHWNSFGKGVLYGELGSNSEKVG